MADVTLKVGISPHLWHGYRYKNDKGDNKIEATVKAKDMQWPAMAKALCQLNVTEKKERGPYMVFAEFKDANEHIPQEFTRRNTNIEQFYGAVLDVDETELEWEEILVSLEATKLNFVMYTTHSYDPLTEGKEHKFRIVVPYSEPVEPADQPVCIVGLASMLGLEADFDNCSKVASQPMYLHAAPQERADDAIAVSNVAGHHLDPDEAYSLGEMHTGTQHAARKPAAEYKTDLSEGERHGEFSRFLARKRREGLAFDEALADLKVWNATLTNPLPDDQMEGMSRVWESFERNNNAFGFAHHDKLLDSAPLKDRDIYLSVIKGIAASDSMLSNSERSDLFAKLKSKRSGSTLRDIQADYKDALENSDEEVVTNVAQLRSRFNKRVQRLLKDYMWLRAINAAYHIPSGTYYKKEAFLAVLTCIWGEIKVEFMPLAVAIKGKPLTFATILEDKLIDVVDDVGYDPREPERFVFRKKLLGNQYVPVDLEPVEGNFKPLMSYFTYLFPDVGDRDFMLDWLAHLVQHPGVKVKYMPVIYTPLEQVGKDFFMKHIVRPMLGESNIGLVGTDYVQERYTEELTGKQLILMQELDFGRDKRKAQQVADKLKPFIADETVQLRRFGMPGGTTSHVASYLAFTNYRDAAFVEGGGMRYYLINGARERQTPEWFAKHRVWFQNNHGRCLHFFQTRDVSKFSFNKNPGNATTTEAQGASVGWPMNVINEAMEEGELDGISCLPWKYFVRLLGILSPPDDQLKVDRLIHRGSSGRIQYIMQSVERFGFAEAKFIGAGRGVNFWEPGYEGDRTKRRKQKILVFPSNGITLDNWKEEAEKSITVVNQLAEEIEF